MYVIGKKDDLSYIGNSGIRNPEPTSQRVLEIAVQRYGGETSAYSVYQVDLTEQDRISEGDEFDLLWSSTPEITGVDFSAEDNKRWLGCVISATDMLANGSNSITVNFQVREPDQVTIDTSVNGNRDVEIRRPNGVVCKIRVNFTDGEGSVIFTTTEAGTWTFPSNQKYISANIRVYENKDVNALYPVS